MVLFTHNVNKIKVTAYRNGDIDGIICGRIVVKQLNHNAHLSLPELEKTNAAAT